MRLAYLALVSVLTLMRLLPMGEQEKDIEILALRHLCRSKIGFCVVSCVFLEFRRLGRTRESGRSGQVFGGSGEQYRRWRVTAQST